MADSIAVLKMLSIDSADAEKDAAFWSAALGWPIAQSGEGYAMLTGPDHALGFGTVEGFTPPEWPNAGGSKQFHFDLAVNDLAEAEEHLSVSAPGCRTINPAGTGGGCCWTLPVIHSA